MGLELILYFFINVILIATSALAFKYWRMLGAIGGLIGAVLSYIVFTSDTLILNTTYDQTAQAFVSQTYPMGFFAWIPIILTGLNFVVALKKK